MSCLTKPNNRTILGAARKTIFIFLFAGTIYFKISTAIWITIEYLSSSTIDNHDYSKFLLLSQNSLWNCNYTKRTTLKWLIRYSKSRAVVEMNKISGFDVFQVINEQIRIHPEYLQLERGSCLNCPGFIILALWIFM